MKRKRIAVTISISFSIRYLVRTGMLERMKRFCEPVIIITWKQQDLIEELTDKGFEVHLMPQIPAVDEYDDHRKKIDIWFKYERLRNFSPNIEKDYLDQFLSTASRRRKRLREYYNVAKLYVPFYKKKLFQKESSLLKNHPGYKILHTFLESLNCEFVFTVTPFHKQEDIFLRVCKDSGLKMITSILSFDNITKRGWIPITYDTYMVWNNYNKKELLEIYPNIKKEQVYITGAPQFDFYFDENYLLSRNMWEDIVGIDKPYKKIILYSGGPGQLFPHEPMYLKLISEAIENGSINGNVMVLFRCHPMDNIERWKLYMGVTKNIVFDKSWTGTNGFGNANIDVQDIKKLCSTLYYTDVHVNVCSTMTLDGTVFHKHQVGPAYTTSKKLDPYFQKLYYQQHFKTITESGIIQLVKSGDELINTINYFLAQSKTSERRKDKLLQSFIGFEDGKNTQRVLTLLENLINSNRFEKQVV